MLAVFAHPEDEVIALGARLERCTISRFLTLTDGAPLDGIDARNHGFQNLEQYRQARRRELHAALVSAGLSPSVAPSLSWTVPDQSASLHLVKLTQAIVAEIDAFRPEAILTHPYEGGHPDHDACAFSVHSALHLMTGASSGRSPVLLEAPSYHAGEDGRIEAGSFLHEGDPGEAITCELSAQEQINKRARLACFASQQETLSQFQLRHECFRIAPKYDFLAKPHAGRLFYEQFPWGMTGETFCMLASEANRNLFARIAVFPNLPLEPTRAR